MLAEANMLSAIHIADNDGVTFETCTAEVFRPVPTHCKTEVSPCAETRKDSAVHVSLSSSLLVKQPETRRSHPLMAERKSLGSLLKGTLQPYSTPNDNRQLSVVSSLV